MTVSSLGAVAAGVERTLPTRNTDISNTVSALLREPVDTIAVNQPSARQADFVALRNASVNIAQTQATVEVAQLATIDIGSLVERAAALATAAVTPNVSDAQRAALDVTFQSIRADINTIATSASFNGQNLLDGTFSAEGAGIQTAAPLNFPELTEGALLGGHDVSIVNAANAAAAQQAVAAARSELAAAQADFAALQSALDFAQANVATALQNRDAASAAIADIDLAVLNANAIQATIAESPTEAVLAQVANLPSNALQLLDD